MTTKKNSLRQFSLKLLLHSSNLLTIPCMEMKLGKLGPVPSLHSYQYLVSGQQTTFLCCIVYWAPRKITFALIAFRLFPLPCMLLSHSPSPLLISAFSRVIKPVSMGMIHLKSPIHLFRLPPPLSPSNSGRQTTSCLISIVTRQLTPPSIIEIYDPFWVCGCFLTYPLPSLPPSV